MNLLKPVVLPLFFLSGACGLVYEVAWVRLFVRVFGNTTYSVTAVLSAFMAGLALGSFLLGRRADRAGRPLILYSLLEGGIGLAALAVPVAVPLLQPLYAYLFNTLGFSDALLTLVRFALSFLLMLLPAVLMGGTLPVMSRFYIRRLGHLGAKAGLLYGINTLGATAGCFLAGFYGIEVFGVRGTVYLAAAVNLVIGAVAVLLDRFMAGRGVAETKEIPDDGEASVPALTGTPRAVFLVLVGLAGFASLSYEVLWTRLLVFKLKTTVYAFSSMLTTFLMGIGLGGVLFSAAERRFRNINYPHLWAALQGAVAVSGFASILLFGIFERLPFSAAVSSGWTAKVVYTGFFPSLVIMLLPTLLMGVAFPAAVAACTGRIERLSSSMGTVYAANTAGSIFGSLATGFFLVRALGTQGSLSAMAVLGACAAAAVMFLPGAGAFPPGKKSVPSAGKLLKYGALALPALAVLAVIILPPRYLFEYYNIGERRHDRTAVIDYAHEGIEGITTVHHFENGSRVISTGSINVAGTAFTLRTTQKLQAHIPMLLHPGPKRVCQIGFGSGETSRILVSYGIDRLDLVEISRSVIDTSDRFFRDINGGVAHHPRFNAVIMDGANYLRMTGEKYDVIMNDSIWPYYAGNSGLYTAEYFAAAKSRLREGGIMTSWVPVDMDLESLVSLLKTFRAEFPYVGFWYATSHENLHALVVGSLSPMTVDTEIFVRRFERYARKDLSGIGYATPAMMLDICKFDHSAVDAMDWDVPLHTEDRPYLEYALSRTTMHDMENSLSLVRLYRQPADILLSRGAGGVTAGALRRDMATLHEATGHVLAGLVMSARLDPRYLDEYRRALRIRPDYPGISRRVDGDKTPGPGAVADTRLLLSRARALLGEGRADEAAAHARRVLEIDPGSGEALTLLGETYIRKGRLVEAAELLRRALREEPGRFEACYHLGWIALRRGDLDGAVMRFKKGIDINPNAAELHYALGKTYGFQDRLEKARQSYGRAVRLTPFDAEPYYEMGLIDERRGRYGEARRNFEKAIRFNPRHEGALQRLGLPRR